MFLLVGIGNIGKEYIETKHNIGFMLVEELIKKYSFVKQGNKFHSECWIGNIGNKKGIIIEPQTFVNESGVSVGEVMRFYKIELKNIYVFHDDMDLVLGKIKYKVGGGSAGHNGIKSIDEHIGKEYNRIRIGIGKPEFKNDTSNFVLSRFKNSDKDIIIDSIDRVVNNIELVLEDNKALFLNKLSVYANRKA